ncbi:triacylglycerol lipase OBL1-like [Rosa rugosa]|uniref:triacylglycerol lipase OBL1-like n=1 Tax=Rosa rugosa TaxID=74645 RepID=UPI002B410ADC|nr:triacylglycerol lipase OBL1-like [Rosa rugosa]
MASKEHVCDNYVFLKPEEVTLIELSRFLFSSDLENRRFINSSEEEGKKGGNLERRWIIFISVVLQWVFLFCSVPMARIGDVLQKWLNLVSTNGGPLMLFLNWLRGKVVKPDSLSSTSVLGNLDRRIELDKSIKPEDTRYKAALSIMAAKLSYENKDLVQSVVNHHWKMKFVGFYNFRNGYQGRDSTQAFLFKDTLSDPNLIVVAFRGTAPFDADAWRTDFDISWCEFNKVGKTHGGFMKALGLQPNNRWPLELETDQLQGSHQHPQFAYYTIRQMLKDLLQEDENAKFILTGHSLGGALAVLFAGVLAMHDCEYAWLLEKLEGVYTFGQPRVGDGKFGVFMKEKFRKYDVKYMRYVYSNDLVPRIPYDDKALLFKHFGPSLYYNSCYRGKVLKEEPNKNYFSLLWFIPKRLNAVWELLRSFILPLVRGSDYKEGWFMGFWRLVGLVIPGLAAHAPQDYVNLTRLGTLLIPKESPKVQ